MPATWDNYPVNYRPATEADIFAAFESGAEDEEEFVEIADFPFGPAMSLYHWSIATADMSYRFSHLRDWLVETYRCKINRGEWRRFARKPKLITIADVCRFAVNHGAVALDTKPLRIAGRDCAEAGTFLTLRSAMSEVIGAKVRCRPSTTIDEFARINPAAFGKFLTLTHPKLLIRTSEKFSLLTLITGRILVVLLPTIILSMLLSHTELPYFVVSWFIWLSIAIVLLAIFLPSMYASPRRVEVEGLETMADLSREIVRYQRETQPARIRSDMESGATF